MDGASSVTCSTMAAALNVARGQADAHRGCPVEIYRLPGREPAQLVVVVRSDGVRPNASPLLPLSEMPIETAVAGPDRPVH
jgi:hypothetical protein